MKTQILAFLLICNLLIVSNANPSLLTSRIEVLEGTKIKFTISNYGLNRGPLKFLKWGTPMDSQKDSLRVVGPDGTLAKYTGILLFRENPQPKDYLTVEANTEKSIEIDISDYFEFTTVGVHSVSLNLSPFIELSHRKASLAIFINANVIESQKLIESIVNQYEKKGEQKSRINCQAADATHINSGISVGRRYGLCSSNCLSQNRCNALYVRWFGVMNSNRYTRVRTNFGRITSALGSTVRVHCRPSQHCSAGIIAYVYPNDRARTIYLCAGYFSYRDKGHVMLHEMAHFDSIAATRDHCYGRDACLALARSNPARAVACADNHALLSAECR